MSVSLYHNNFFAMGTRMDIVFWGLERRFAHLVFQELFNKVNWLESVYSRFDENSTIYQINASAGIRPVEISEEVYAVLNRCKHYHALTNGIFDVTFLPLTAANRSIKRNNKTQEASFEQVHRKTGMDKLQLDPDSSTAYLEVKGMSIDLGGIGKGIALESIDQILSAKGINHAFISFGESSILAKGRHPYGNCWKLGIRHIDDNSRNVYSFDLKDSSLSTSGIHSKESKDIINPKNGTSPDTISTISVVSKSPSDAEVLSTSLLLTGKKETAEILNNFNPEKATKIQYLNEEPHVEELYIRPAEKKHPANNNNDANKFQNPISLYCSQKMNNPL